MIWPLHHVVKYSAKSVGNLKNKLLHAHFLGCHSQLRKFPMTGVQHVESKVQQLI